MARAILVPVAIADIRALVYLVTQVSQDSECQVILDILAILDGVEDRGGQVIRETVVTRELQDFGDKMVQVDIQVTAANRDGRDTQDTVNLDIQDTRDTLVLDTLDFQDGQDIQEQLLQIIVCLLI